MIFIETAAFSKTIQALLTDDEYRELQGALLENPARGDLIPGGAGLRKLRWARQGMGKSGGLRTVCLARGKLSGLDCSQRDAMQGANCAV